MNTAWELSKLDPATFEHLVNALMLRVLGCGATGFGPGADAGRDGYFEGKAPYPSDAEAWDGIWYIQAKYHAPHLTKDAQAWIVAQIESELAAFKNPRKKRQWPTNWIVATNIDLSAGRGGTFEKTRREVSKARPELAKRFHVWGGQKILELLSQHPDVAARYGHFLTPGNVLSELVESLKNERPTVEQIVQGLVVHGFKEQRRTRIEQAGSREDEIPGIEALFIDLPFVDVHHRVIGSAVETLHTASSECHRADETDVHAQTWCRWRRHPRRSPVWFVHAGPGRGKSTIGQFFCQVQRAALISQDKALSRRRDLRDIVAAVRKAAETLLVWPASPRIPIWVELKSYAAWFAEQKTTDPRGVLTWIATDLRRVLERDVSAPTVSRALRHAAWLVVFDGLDEVPSSIKDSIAGEVVQFVDNTTPDSDLMTLCTSRPQGYSGQFDSLAGAVIELIDLAPDTALECAARVTRIGRTKAEADLAREVLTRALQTPAVREIMTTPLQAHIMAVLVRNGARPPERKWDLYARFYEVIREREANRNLPDPRLKSLLQGDSRIIDAVHQRLGFILHAKAETGAGADASLSRADFRRLVSDVVGRFGAQGRLEEMVDVVTSAATERLVLINTPDNGSHVRFDVRAIQEFFAAGFLYEDVLARELGERLELIAGDSHWREVVQFVLQALVSTRRRTERNAAFDVLRWLDAGGEQPAHRPLARMLALGAAHAARLLINGVAETDQQVRTQLRDLLDPLASGGSVRLFAPPIRVGPQTRETLWRWAIDALRTRALGQSSGAASVVVAMICGGEIAVEESFEAVEHLHTRLLDEIVGGLIQQDPQDPRELGNPKVAWERRLISHIFTREDVTRAASESTWYALQAAKHDRTRYWPQLGQQEFRSFVGHRALFAYREEMFGTIVYSTTVLTQHGRAHLSREYKEKKFSTPFSRWLSYLLASCRTAPSAAHVRETLLLGPNDWFLYQTLPEELTKSIPVPMSLQGAIAPWRIAEMLNGVSDDALASGLRSHKLFGTRLKVLRTGVSVSLPSQVTVEEVRQLVTEYPGAIESVVIQCWRHSTPAWKSLRGAIAEILKADPDLTECLPDQFLLYAYYVGSDEVKARVLDLGRMARLNADWTDEPIEYASQDIADDRALFSLKASHLLSEALMVVGGRWEREGSGAPRNFRAIDAPRVGELLRVADDRDEKSEIRASAILLAALHSDGGVSILFDRRRELVEFARQGIAVTASAALALELAGARRGDAADLLSALLEADHEMPCFFALNTVLHRWREHSEAPVTAGRVLDRWVTESE